MRKPYNALVTLGMVPVKMLTGGNWRQQLIWAKTYLGIDQFVEADGCRWFIAASLPISQVPFLLHEYRWSRHLTSLQSGRVDG